MNEKYFCELKKIIHKAIKKDEVPVAALIVMNNKIIGKGYNKKNKNKNALLHAEIIAIQKAIKYIKDWRLNDCDLYVTLKPCKMCESVINEFRIRNVYYLLENEKQINYNTNFCKVDSKLTNEYKNILQNFFKNKR